MLPAHGTGAGKREVHNARWQAKPTQATAIQCGNPVGEAPRRGHMVALEEMKRHRSRQASEAGIGGDRRRACGRTARACTTCPQHRRRARRASRKLVRARRDPKDEKKSRLRVHRERAQNSPSFKSSATRRHDPGGVHRQPWKPSRSMLRRENTGGRDWTPSAKHLS